VRCGRAVLCALRRAPHLAHAHCASVWRASRARRARQHVLPAGRLQRIRVAQSAYSVLFLCALRVHACRCTRLTRCTQICLRVTEAGERKGAALVSMHACSRTPRSANQRACQSRHRGGSRAEANSAIAYTLCFVLCVTDVCSVQQQDKEAKHAAAAAAVRQVHACLRA
jgi:hypothetical protein